MCTIYVLTMTPELTILRTLCLTLTSLAICPDDALRPGVTLCGAHTGNTLAILLRAVEQSIQCKDFDLFLRGAYSWQWDME